MHFKSNSNFLACFKLLYMIVDYFHRFSGCPEYTKAPINKFSLPLDEKQDLLLYMCYATLHSNKNLDHKFCIYSKNQLTSANTCGVYNSSIETRTQGSINNLFEFVVNSDPETRIVISKITAKANDHVHSSLVDGSTHPTSPGGHCDRIGLSILSTHKVTIAHMPSYSLSWFCTRRDAKANK